MDEEPMDVSLSIDEAFKFEILGKPPYQLEDGNPNNEELGIVVAVEDRRVYSFIVDTRGVLLSFANPKQFTIHNFNLRPGGAYILVMRLNDQYNIQLQADDDPVDDENDEPAAVVIVITLADEKAPIDVPLRETMPVALLMTAKREWGVRYYPTNQEVETLVERDFSSTVYLPGENDHNDLGIFENSTVVLRAKKTGTAYVQNISEWSNSQAMASPFTVDFIRLNNRFVSDLCAANKQILNLMEQRPYLDQDTHVNMVNNSVKNLDVASRVLISIGQPESPLQRLVRVNKGHTYILVCNENELFDVSCIESGDLYASILVIAMKTTPTDFCIPIRSDRNVILLLPGSKNISMACIRKEATDVDYSDIRKTAEYQFPLDKNSQWTIPPGVMYTFTSTLDENETMVLHILQQNE